MTITTPNRASYPDQKEAMPQIQPQPLTKTGFNVKREKGCYNHIKTRPRVLRQTKICSLDMIV